MIYRSCNGNYFVRPGKQNDILPGRRLALPRLHLFGGPKLWAAVSLHPPHRTYQEH